MQPDTEEHMKDLAKVLYDAVGLDSGRHSSGYLSSPEWMAKYYGPGPARRDETTRATPQPIPSPVTEHVSWWRRMLGRA